MRWDSDGEGQYQIQADPKTDRGTEVILHLREDDKEFLEPSRLRQLVRKYSDHLSIPIILKEGETQETINQAKAFWTRSKSELNDMRITRRSTSTLLPRLRARAYLGRTTRSSGNIEYTSLLYLPKRGALQAICSSASRRAEFSSTSSVYSSWTRRRSLLPPWLRFMRGLVDTADLPLERVARTAAK